MQRCHVNATIETGKYYGLNESGNLGLDWNGWEQCNKDSIVSEYNTANHYWSLRKWCYFFPDVIVWSCATCDCNPYFFPMTTLCGQGSRGKPRYQETWSWHTRSGWRQVSFHLSFPFYISIHYRVTMPSTGFVCSFFCNCAHFKLQKKNQRT